MILTSPLSSDAISSVSSCVSRKKDRTRSPTETAITVFFFGRIFFITLRYPFCSLITGSDKGARSLSFGLYSI